MKWVYDYNIIARFTFCSFYFTKKIRIQKGVWNISRRKKKVFLSNHSKKGMKNQSGNSEF